MLSYLSTNKFDVKPFLPHAHIPKKEKEREKKEKELQWKSEQKQRTLQFVCL